MFKGLNDSMRNLDETTKLVAKENSKKKQREIELTEASKETAIAISDFKKIVKEFIEASEEQTKSTNRLNKRIFWFTLVSVVATVISTGIAIIQFIK